MSVLLNEDNILLISHEDYIQQAFTNVQGTSYRFNKDVFAISEPFKTYENNSKCPKKKCIEIIDVNSFPSKIYNKYQTQILEHLCILTDKTDKTINSLDNKETNQVEAAKVPIVPTQQNINSPKQETSETSEHFLKRKLHSATDKSRVDKTVPNLIALNTVSRLQCEESTTSGKFNGSNTFPYSIIRNFNGADFLFPPACKFINNDVLNHADYTDLQGKFDVIVMDPPWTNKAIRRKNKKQSSSKCTPGTYGYAFMSNDDIVRLPVDEWLTQNGVVFVWCTNSSEHRKAVDRFFIAWNLINVGVWYWLKVTKRGKPIIPFVVEELNMKQPYEMIVIGARGDMATKWRPDLKEKMIVSVPSAMHSHKPPLADIVKTLFSGFYDCGGDNVKCLEVFARYLLPGWTSIGNEVLKFQNLCFYERISADIC